MDLDSVSEREFDWWACDRDGHVAAFSTAGYGEIPVAVVAGFVTSDDADVAEAMIERLAITGDWRPDSKGPGKGEEWKELGRRGVFVFDWVHWRGPYRRIVVPEVPIRLEDLPEDLRRVATIVRFEAHRFPECGEIDVGREHPSTSRGDHREMPAAATPTTKLATRLEVSGPGNDRSPGRRSSRNPSPNPRWSCVRSRRISQGRAWSRSTGCLPR